MDGAAADDGTLRERALAERVRAGDATALETLFRAHYDALCDYAHALIASRADAEDVVQGVFVNLWAERERWAPRASVRAYLYGAVRNRVLNVLAHRRVERRTREDVARETAAAGAAAVPASDAAEAEELSARVRDAIARLPQRAREAVVLRWQHQLRHAEIAQAMGISVKGVEALLARARVTLREQLGGLVP